ncbi:ParA family protein [Candidatus Methylospira mobilis]|uniref:ParA family protein n=1 Tax=Candidatus Methylospira mobilis TaxID=1808979 RepID=UPI0028E331AD|nr:ParA family protein [Candidatus Methylospira mobilis]WNV05837.1 ParA family protein [Candidatus Methylospira mobilis]
MKILSFANQKGGVGKSTLTAHVAYAAQELGLRVLLVDMDNQGSLSLTFPGEEGKEMLMASTLYSTERTDAEPDHLSDKLSIIRADMGLLAIDKAENKVIRLPGTALSRFHDRFDLCLIDTPPLLGIRLMASLAASDFVVTPVSVGLYELAGVANLLQTIHVIRTQGFNRRLRHIGILPMKINMRSKQGLAALNDLRQQPTYGDLIMPETLSEREPVRQAVAERRPVWTKISGEGHVKAAGEWRAACNAILKRVNHAGVREPA